MTRQEAFNLNWEHFVVQKHPKCVDQEDNCIYSDGKGNCCGIGLLFSPDLRDALKGRLMPVDELLGLVNNEVPADDDLPPRLVPELQGIFDTLDMNFLEDLQGCHDNVVCCPILIEASPILIGPQPRQFERRLSDLAQKYDLVVPGTGPQGA